MIRSRIRIGKTTLLYVFLVLEYLIDTNVLYLVDIPHFVMPMTNLLLFCFYMVAYKKDIIFVVRKYKKSTNMIVIYVLSYLILFGISIAMYPNQSLYETLVGENESFNLLQIIFFFPMLSLIEREKGFMRALDILNILSVVLCLLGIIQIFVYAQTGYIFLGGYFTDGHLTFRYGTLRILPYYISNIMAIFSFFMFYNVSPQA